MKQWTHSIALIITLAISGALPFTVRAASGDRGHAVGEEHSHRNPDTYSQMSDMMHHMAGQLKDMSAMMRQSDVDPAMDKQIAERMQTMSAMMDHMSGMMGKEGKMDAAGMQKEMSEMSKQMDDMMKSPMGSGMKK